MILSVFFNDGDGVFCKFMPKFVNLDGDATNLRKHSGFSVECAV